MDINVYAFPVPLTLVKLSRRSGKVQNRPGSSSRRSKCLLLPHSREFRQCWALSLRELPPLFVGTWRYEPRQSQSSDPDYRRSDVTSRTRPNMDSGGLRIPKVEKTGLHPLSLPSNPTCRSTDLFFLTLSSTYSRQSVLTPAGYRPDTRN